MRRALLILTPALFALDAGATPTFPATIRSAESLTYTPACTLCHRGVPSVGTVTTPFGINMRQRGLVAYDEASLRAALAAMESDQVDSDGDGTPDIDELRAGTDPNSATAAPSPDGGSSSSGGGQPPAAPNFPDPSYGFGCGAGVGSSGSAAGIALMALALLARRRKRCPIRVAGRLPRVKRQLREKNS
jgi:MYXO-CTERM domain-containing protein